MVRNEPFRFARRRASWLSWLAILLIALAPSAMGLGLPAAAAGGQPAPTHHQPAAGGSHHHAAGQDDLGRHAPDAPAGHHQSAASCCAIGCAVMALLDEQRVEGPAPHRLKAVPASDAAAGRATSPPHRPPRPSV